MKKLWSDADRSWLVKDISVPLDADLPLWPQSPGVRLEWVKRLAAGDGCNNAVLHCDLHAGTHIDAPLHHLETGADVAGIDVQALCGPAFVAHCPGRARLGPAELAGLDIAADCRRLLLRTDNSRLWKTPGKAFRPDFTALTEDGAQWLTARGVRLVGIDSLSVQPYGGEQPRVHAILFEAGAVVLEGLALDGVDAGWWELLCLPLPLAGAEASPVRAVLRRPALEDRR